MCDQDFHYYGTYVAAMLGGFDGESAATIAKAANFVDFLSDDNYPREPWVLLMQDHAVGKYDRARYTFQDTTAVGPWWRRVWSAFHFLPGNYPDADIKMTESHLGWIINLLPKQHEIRTVKNKEGNFDAKRITRPLSGASRAIMLDTFKFAQNNKDLENILINSQAVYYMFMHDGDGNLDTLKKRFLNMLIGIRAHVIADTWAHQDWCAEDTKCNTYHDLHNDSMYTRIEFIDQSGKSKACTLRTAQQFWNQNFAAAPDGIQYGHGWMGHFPDFSFIKYKYRPRWDGNITLDRNNPEQFFYAFLELVNLFLQVNKLKAIQIDDRKIQRVKKAIGESMVLDWLNKNEKYGRVHSAEQWISAIKDMGMKMPPGINAGQEPSDGAVFDKDIHKFDKSREVHNLKLKRDGQKDISDLYLFQVAADYHFHFVSAWLDAKKINVPLVEDTIDVALGPVLGGIHDVVAKRLQIAHCSVAPPKSATPPSLLPAKQELPSIKTPGWRGV